MVVAKKASQVVTHMSIAFVIAYAMTGSALFGGLAVVIEPVINVLLLPLHEKAWAAIRARSGSGRHRVTTAAGEKLSQTVMHFGVAFTVMYFATDSLAFGGIAALLEPICNVVLLPFHDRFWDKLALRVNGKMSIA